MFNPWQMAKNIIFQSLVEISFFIFWGQIIIFGFPKEEFKKKLKFIIPPFIFIIILGLATLFSPTRWFSFWGYWERKLGFLTWLHFFIFYVILLLNIKNKVQIKRIILTVLITATLVAFYGFMQFARYDPFEWDLNPILKISDYRVFSSLGQPNFLASWLLLVIPLNILAIFIYKKRIVRFFLFLLFSILIVLLILTQSRGGLIGFIFEIVFLLLSFSYFKKKKKIFIFISIVLILGILFIFWINSKNIDLEKTENNLFNRLQSLVNLKEAGEYRLWHWQASLELIKKKPILGYGLESQRFYFPSYYRKEFAMKEAPNIFLDRAHNDILDVLLNSGFLGLISWWFFLGYLFYQGFKTVKRGKINILFLLAGIFGYLVSLQFSFHTHSTLLYFWIWAILIFLNNDDNEFKIDCSKKYFKEKPEVHSCISKIQIAIIFLLIILTCSFIWFINGYEYLASHYLLKAEIAKIEGKGEDADIFYTKSIKYGRNDPYFRQMSAEGMLELGLMEQDLSKKMFFIQTGIKQIEDIPNNLRPIEARIYLPQLLTQTAKLTNNPDDFEKAEYYFKDLIEFSPNLALAWRNWAELDIVRKDWDKAREKINLSLNLCPDPFDKENEHSEEVISEIIAAKEKLARIELETGNYDKSLEIYNEILRLDPEQFFVWQKISEIYEMKGDKDNAIKAQNEFLKRMRDRNFYDL
jgi:putative inorganic carbon (HCO3(-)) transporter